MKRYLAIPGAVLLIAAFIRATVTVEWDTTSLALAAAGAIVVTITVIWNREEVIEWSRDPRGVFAVTTGVSVAAFIAVLVLLNIAVWYRPWSVDLTTSGRNEVSDETRRILQRLAQPVTLRKFGGAVDPGLDRLLAGFERETPRLRVEVADPDRDKAMAVKYDVFKAGTIVVLAGDRFRKIEEPNEQALVTAVLQVTSDEKRVICFVSGHGERGLADTGPTGLAVLAETLDASNYGTEAISLLEDEVPPRCSALAVVAPWQPLAPEELTRLEGYLTRNGRVAVLLEPDPAPSLAEWLRPLGVEPGAGSIVDVSGAGRTVGGGPRAPLAVAYPDHPVTRGFGIITMYEGARPLRVIDMPELGGKAAPLARTSPRSFATPVAEGVPTFDASRDQPGPVTLAAAITRGGRGADEEARLAVFGDSDFISNAFVRQVGNRDFIVRTLAWLIGQQEATIVAVDDRENRRIDLTESMRAWMYIVNLGVLPLIPLVAGIIVFVRSRR